MKSVILLVFILVCYAYPISDPYTKKELIIWNIGQGQWITWINYDSCTHFDIGGEKIPWKQIMNFCHGKTNKIFFSHKDKDHTQWAYALFKKEKHSNTTTTAASTTNTTTTATSDATCLLSPITTPPYPKRFKEIPMCLDQKDYLSWQRFQPPKNIKIKDYNFHSEVMLFKKFLFTGDSTKEAEKYWVPNLTNQNLIKILVLGHHGSKTSTSKLLLKNLPKLSQCISSSRKARYGHPHKETLDRLKEKKCPHLNTEQWGHIHFIY